MTERAGQWTPPDGLARSRPREVRLSAGGRGLIVAVGALWLGAVGIWVGLGSVVEREAVERRLVQEQGVDGQAEVTRLWRARGEKRQPWVAFRFEADGRRQERQAKASLSTWNTLQVGGPLAIRYVPSRPELAFLRGRSPDGTPFFLPHVLGAALLAAGCATLLPLFGQRRLLSEGRAANGVVTRHAKGQHGAEAHYDFRTLGGTLAHGKAGPKLKPPAVGSSVCVLYDPDRPGKNALYPLALVRLADMRSFRPSAASDSRRPAASRAGA